ncbi:hypothetical protein K0M31_007950, partial [Melipona bicolor]
MPRSGNVLHIAGSGVKSESATFEGAASPILVASNDIPHAISPPGSDHLYQNILSDSSAKHAASFALINLGITSPPQKPPRQSKLQQLPRSAPLVRIYDLRSRCNLEFHGPESITIGARFQEWIVRAFDPCIRFTLHEIDRRTTSEVEVRVDGSTDG